VFEEITHAVPTLPQSRSEAAREAREMPFVVMRPAGPALRRLTEKVDEIIGGRFDGIALVSVLHLEVEPAAPQSECLAGLHRHRQVVALFEMRPGSNKVSLQLPVLYRVQRAGLFKS
jgi:hypothetical protein